MKRSELRRKTPLAPQKEPLRRSKPPGRAKGRLARSKAQKPKLSQETRAKAFARTKGACAVPGCRRRARDPHHLLPKQDNKWPELADVAENVVGVCREHHEAHEHGNLKRLPWAVVKPVLALPLTAKQIAYLQRTYPQE